VIVTFNQNLYNDQLKTLYNDLERCQGKLSELSRRLTDRAEGLVTFNDEAELYEVNYVEMIPILVEAIKEQQVQIEELQTAIGSGEALKGAAVNTTNPDPQSSDPGTSTLYQNAPNPFTEETTISYNLSNNVNTATLFINDMNGKQLRSYELPQRGNAEFRINGGELDAGMYLYSLVADGYLIGTKQMLLTK
ncbi:MAG: T9SS type A sorting domain-containing protein, partial [Bacteroidales bacterium]|nr:T9SS type A sorting domain-containing protein [Bacteroidales bacterium]